MKPTIMIMAGGTGGHIFPGLAVADVLAHAGWHIVWMGRPDGMEARLVPPKGHEMAWLPFKGVRQKGLMGRLLTPWHLARSLLHAWTLVRRHRPDVVLGMGGYISFPGGVAARLCGIPLLIHEQNSVAGLANRHLARFATQVLSGFPDVLPKAEWVGNPVRASIAALSPPSLRYGERTGPLRVLIIGGSLGAHALNEAVPAALARLPCDQRPEVWHQSGEAHLAALQAAYAEHGIVATTAAFITDMAAAYAWADLVIARAGALTLAEIATAGVASLLVPYPHATDDHQTGNALFLVAHNAAVLLHQHALTPETLAQHLLALNRDTLSAMAERARALARPDAAHTLADCCKAAGEKK